MQCALRTGHFHLLEKSKQPTHIGTGTKLFTLRTDNHLITRIYMCVCVCACVCVCVCVFDLNVKNGRDEMRAMVMLLHDYFGLDI